MEPKTILITQARMGSSRLKGKVLKRIEGDSLLQIHLSRIKKSTKIDEFIVATTLESEDDLIAEEISNIGVHLYRGSVNDVLDRYYQAAKPFNPDWVVRVTADCPLVDPNLIDEIVSIAHDREVDYVSNTLKEFFPDGQDIEVFKFSALQDAWNLSVKSSDREHVTLFLKNNSDFRGGRLFKAVNVEYKKDFSPIRMTVDEMRDFDMMKVLITRLGYNKSWLEYADYIVEHQLNLINGDILRNEGLLKSLEND